MTKDDRDYYMYLRDRRITGNEYYPRVCIQFMKMNSRRTFLFSRVLRQSMSVQHW